jgi:flavin-dependent dehydrogenase
MSDVTVIGAGIIGLACARALAGDGAQVTLVDASDAVRPASRAAAGMCAPDSEALLHPPADPGEIALWRAGLADWEAFEVRAGADCGLDPMVRGTQIVGPDGAVRTLEGERLVDPVRAMARLRAEVLEAGVRIVAGVPGGRGGAVVVAAGGGLSGPDGARTGRLSRPARRPSGHRRDIRSGRDWACGQPARR